MATDAKKIVTLDILDGVKAYIDVKDEVIEAQLLQSGSYSNGKISLYKEKSPSIGATAAIEIDIPKEYFLDQAKTKFVPNFEWSDDTYPGSDDASELDSQAVMVLALKCEDNSVSYSFLSISEAITIYKGGSTNTATTTVTGDTITTDVKISDKTSNLVKSDTNGLYVLPATGEDTDTTTVTVSDNNEISVEVNVSEEDDNALVVTDDGLGVFASSDDDNILEIKEDGSLYVPAPEEVELTYATEEDIQSLFSVDD